ncbi:MAG: FGGY-family carbohydrate kinase [Blautia sp.]|nr:FGGY-family carbohydrate kinase [Blautia sp.]
MADNYLIGMDLGTTNVKAILMDEEGNVLARASRENHLIFPGLNMVEQSPDEWWQNSCQIFQEITSNVSEEVLKNIRGICISSQTVTMLPVDRDGKPLRNAMIWMDTRSAKEMHYISMMLGHDHFVDIIGGQPDVAFLPNKILWYKKNEPELFRKTCKVLQASSYINLRLTGKMTADKDQAVRTQCLDINRMEWSEEIGDVLGVNLQELLPEISEVTDIIGTVTEEASRLTGLPSGIPVTAGASDAMTSVYATGLTRIGEGCESSGTTSLVFAGSETPSANNVPVVTKPYSVEGVPYIFDAPINTSGAAIKWYIDNMGQLEAAEAARQGMNVYTYLNEAAMNVPAGSNGTMFFPYLLGERAPLWNSHARGMFIGMSMDTRHNDFLRAVFEGTAFALRHVVETIKASGAKVDCLRITGGGSKSRTWSMIKASMLRVPVMILDGKSGDVPFGAALIAGQATGVFRDMTETIRKVIKVKEVIQPNEEWARIYDKLYPYYIQMYQDLDKDFLRLRNTWIEIEAREKTDR